MGNKEKATPPVPEPADDPFGEPVEMRCLQDGIAMGRYLGVTLIFGHDDEHVGPGLQLGNEQQTGEKE